MIITTNYAIEDSRRPTQFTQKMDKVTRVYVRLMFLRIGEIDTLNEKYQAQAAVEARWPVDVDQLSSDLSTDDQKRLSEGKSVTLNNYAKSHWHPQLYIENAVGDLKEQIRYSAKRSKDDNQIYVCEHRDIKGVFWEKLELHHFPSDVQDLSISIASMLYDDRVLLIADPYYPSGVNREAFVDQQEWLLYAHVDSAQRFVEEFSFQSAEDDDDENTTSSEDRRRSILTVTCHAARRSDYFYWNGYCLIFLITLVSFCLYGIPPHLVANRIQIAATLLLTSITFRWTVNRSLPTISYLTSMDRYGLICIFYLVINCIYHSIIGVLIFLLTPNFLVKPGMWLTKVDQMVFFISFGVFILGHFVLIGWVYAVPLKHRRKIEEKDKQHRSSISGRKSQRKGQSTKPKTKGSSSYERIRIE